MIDLPEGWTIEPFSQVARYTTGRTPARANPAYWAKGERQVPWVAISDMEQYGIITETAESVSALAFEHVFRERIVPAGTLLMSFKLTIGRVATLGIPACHNEAIISIFPREGVDQRYLGYFLSQVDYADHQDRQIKGNTLNQSKIDQIQVVLPPSNEQSRIADVLDKCRLGINTERAAEKTAEELKRAAMRELFTRGLRGEPQKDTEIGLMPESWSPRTILDLCEIWSGGTPRKSVTEYWKGDIPWVSGKDLKRPVLDDAIDHVSAAGVEAGSRLAPEGAVLLLVRGMGLAKDLPVAVINRPMAFNQDVKALVSRGQYSGQFLRSAIYAGKERLLSQIVPSAHGTMTLNLNDVETFKVACPSDPDEAKDIVSILDTLDSKIDLHQKKRKVLEELFESLLHKLMTGEIAVSDLDLSALSPASTQPEEATA
ncbi:TPA: restriction endonuclease subunit S [Stenotrophomonas maltophilia]